MKILYVAPHLSTGGMPQYLYEMICHHIDHQIEVVDVTNSGGDAYVVQKNRIKQLVPVHTLSQQSDLLKIVKDFNPDVIHYQEVPENFLSKEILSALFWSNREHFNIVTTHSSLTDPDAISYHPDRYVFACEWSRQKFSHLRIDSHVWEYPIKNYSVSKDEYREALKLDGAYKHVLNVGLFTPGKNQAELFEIARKVENKNIMFHFVGNQAPNFKHYWEPLMLNKPSNCIIWGERDDVDLFYGAADLFYFSSKFELNPISIKEALSYKLPCMFRKLETYLDMYDFNERVTYLTDNIEKNIDLLLEKLKA